MDPAATSASPAVTTMCVDAIAPDIPAASANGTVRPSAMPMTTSRTVSPPVKCFSTCCMAQSCPDTAVRGKQGWGAMKQKSSMRSIFIGFGVRSVITDSATDLSVRNCRPEEGTRSAVPYGSVDRSSQTRLQRCEPSRHFEAFTTCGSRCGCTEKLPCPLTDELQQDIGPAAH